MNLIKIPVLKVIKYKFYFFVNFLKGIYFVKNV